MDKIILDDMLKPEGTMTEEMPGFQSNRVCL